MAQEVQWPTQQRTELVDLSFCKFAFWWFIILGIHLITCAYNVAYAALYWSFEQTIFYVILEYHETGMPSRHNRTVAYIFMALASIHGICALLMIVGSLWQRNLVFQFRRTSSFSLNKTLRRTSSTGPGSSPIETEVSTSTAKVVRFLLAVYHRVASQHGLFGVKGEHFHVLLICREVVEVALQTAQAIQMSRYLPRWVLNRFYVSLLAINCCSSVFVYSRWFSDNEARRRFAAVICDCILNLMTTIGVSLIIMLRYVNEYDVDAFRWQHLKDDKWISQTLNEVQVVLVVSWTDLVARIIFSLSLVATTIDMKSLLSYSAKRKKQVVNTAGPSLDLTRNLGSLPEQIKFFTRETTNKTMPWEDVHSTRGKLVCNGAGLRGRKRFILRLVHKVFALWGVVVLALHLHASMQKPLQECAPEVFPMAGSLASCYAVHFNCYTLGFPGTKDDLEAEWKRFDRSTVVKLRILHCPSFEMPDSFLNFSAIQEITVYNSTILNWDDTVAMTNEHHPRLRQIYLSRVNMTDGLLPLSFQSQDFPVEMMQMSLCETNLEILPDDLNWPTGFIIYIENSKLTTIPSSFAQMKACYLAFTGNPFTNIPPEFFEAGSEVICIGNSGLNELPREVTPTMVSVLDITQTNISSFPAWMDTLIEISLQTSPIIYAGESPYCSDLTDIMNGDATSFSAPFHPDNSLVLMNASEANWGLLQQIVDCSLPLGSLAYPLDYDDEMYALGQGVGM